MAFAEVRGGISWGSYATLCGHSLHYSPVQTTRRQEAGMTAYPIRRTLEPCAERCSAGILRPADRVDWVNAKSGQHGRRIDFVTMMRWPSRQWGLTQSLIGKVTTPVSTPRLIQYYSQICSQRFICRMKQWQQSLSNEAFGRRVAK